MDREEALREFLKGFRVVFNTASAYPKNHPYYLNTVEKFKEKIYFTFRYLNPIKIGVAPDALFMDGRQWKKDPLYLDLARMFHTRKIKSVEFDEGFTTEELAGFLSSVSLPLKEVLGKGGLHNIMPKEKTPHLVVEELDYSALLGNQGEEGKDIWTYLLADAIGNIDFKKINEFADNFEKIIVNFKAKDLTEDEELRKNIVNFLSYLKEKEKERFDRCTKGLLRLFLHDGAISAETKLDKAKVFFQDLKKEDLSEQLMDGIVSDDNFNTLSFAVFSKLFDENLHKEIIPNLEQKVKDKEFLKEHPRIKKKIKELFSLPESSFITPLYRVALSELLQGSALEAKFCLEEDTIQEYYHYDLLNLLANQKDKGKLNFTIEIIFKECDRIAKQAPPRFLKAFSEALDRRIETEAGFAVYLKEIRKRLYNFIENLAFEFPDIPDFDYLQERFTESSLGWNIYFQKIFREKKINTQVWKLLLKFFPDKLRPFFKELKKKDSDIEFMARTVKGLGEIDSVLSLRCLKVVFSFTSNLIRIEILKVMRHLTHQDERFLLSLLNKEEILLRKESFINLAKNEEGKKKAIQRLLFVDNSFGISTRFILENIFILENSGIGGLRESLQLLSKKAFFWNRGIRQRAKEALEKIHG
jgi:hypothetical protein